MIYPACMRIVYMFVAIIPLSADGYLFSVMLYKACDFGLEAKWFGGHSPEAVILFSTILLCTLSILIGTVKGNKIALLAELHNHPASLHSVYSMLF